MIEKKERRLERDKESSLLESLIVRNTLMASFNFNYLHQDLPNIVILGVGASTCDYWGNTNIQFVTGANLVITMDN
jgi:hypothetical protein